MNYNNFFLDYIKSNIQVQKDVLEESTNDLAKTCTLITNALKNGNKLMLCGNGGSAGQAQHIAAEFTGRYLLERHALPAISLTTDTSCITAIGNDYGFEKIFARQVEALGNKGDILIALSTSGKSENILLAVKTAKTRGLKIISLTGLSGTRVAKMSDVALVVPSDITSHIQEAHIVMLHAVCSAVEASMFLE